MINADGQRNGVKNRNIHYKILFPTGWRAGEFFLLLKPAGVLEDSSSHGWIYWS